jgi:hypothetical protein
VQQTIWRYLKSWERVAARIIARQASNPHGFVVVWKWMRTKAVSKRPRKWIAVRTKIETALPFWAI